LTDILAALVSMGCLALLLRVWKPAQTFRFKDEPATAAPMAQPRPVMGASSDLPGEAAATRAPAQKPASPLAAYFMYVVLVVVVRRRRVNFFKLYAQTLRQLALPIVTIAFILSIAYLMNFSGMTSSLAIAFSKTGFVFPFVAAFLGWLGVFLTGSDTSSNT